MFIVQFREIKVGIEFVPHVSVTSRLKISILEKPEVKKKEILSELGNNNNNLY